MKVQYTLPSKFPALLGALVCGALLASCAKELRRFPLKAPIWEDKDRNTVPKKPSEYYSGLMADGADMMVFYPLAQAPLLRIPGEAANLNAFDEVPNSSWFTNRMGMFPYSPEDAYKGACKDEPTLDPKKGPWVISGAKPNGANPGFFIKAADGHRYLLKFDGVLGPPRATASDVIGSKIYYAAGFNTPCNEVIYFPESILHVPGIDPPIPGLKTKKKVMAENQYGEKVPVTREDIDKVLSKAFRLKNGMLRASASRFVNGRPIGPFTYQGTRSDDPNDVIDHEDRRELRGSQLLAAWINHFDSREQNTLDAWWKEDGRQFLKHFIIDWGDSLGGRWPRDSISRRLGRSYYLDWEHVGLDYITLGLYPRTWNKLRLNKIEIFNYFDGMTFTSSKWRGGYPNPAHDRLTPADALWMIRIMARFTEKHIRAIVATAKLPDKRHEEFLVRRLIERRHRIFEEYLSKHAPLARFTVARRKKGSDVQSLCFEDLAVRFGIVDKDVVHYKIRFRGGEELDVEDHREDEELGFMEFYPDSEHPHRSCMVLPIGHRRPADLVKPGTRDDHPLRYGIMDIFVHQKRSVLPTSSMRLHFYDLGQKRGFRMVGIERPPEPVVPDRY